MTNKKSPKKAPPKRAMAKEELTKEEITNFLTLIEDLQIETVCFSLLAMKLKEFTDRLHPKGKALKFFKNLPKHIDGAAKDR